MEEYFASRLEIIMNNTNPCVFVIEDDEDISKLICLYLNKSQINTQAFYTAEEALTEIKNKNTPDLIVLDLNLPGMSGIDFLKKLRTDYSSLIPIIIVSATNEEEEIVEALGIGADNYVTKPFSPSILAARIQAALRRQNFAVAQAEESIIFDDYTLLLRSCVLKKGSHKIPLSAKEYMVLEYLLKNAGQTLSPEKIYYDVWNLKYGDVTAVAVYIQRLRKKIKKSSGNASYIKTVFGKGYIFSCDSIIHSSK